MKQNILYIDKIFKTICITENPSYVIMNGYTAELLKNHCSKYLLQITPKSHGYGEIYGVPIALCEKLKDGEFEVL